MAENRQPLPADLPEDWNVGQIVAPTGEEVGLSHQHGYNYLMEMVNQAQRGVNQNSETLDGVINGDLLKLKDVVTVEGGAEMTMDGAFGNAPYEIVVTEEDGTTGVTSFNGRTGAVMPQPGDYTAEDVGAVPDTCTINGKPLRGNIVIDENKFIKSQVVSGSFNGTDKVNIPICDLNDGWAPFVGVRVTVHPSSDTTIKAFLGDAEILSGPVSKNGSYIMFLSFMFVAANENAGYTFVGASTPRSTYFYVSLASGGSYTAEIVRYGPFLPA